MTHLKIEQNNTAIEQVSGNVIEKLYQLAFSGDLDASSNLVGRLHTTATYQEYVDFLTQQFQDLYINADKYYLMFQDPTVEQILISRNVGDGVGITQQNLSNIATFSGNWFYNSSITSFPELQYFNPSSIGSQANQFEACTRLTSITLPIGTTTIGNKMFSGCNSLREVINTNNVTTLNNSSFSHCTSLVSIDLPNIQTIGAFAFSNCSALTSIGNAAPATIQQNAFQNCLSLTSINLSNVRQIDADAFNGCTSLAMEVELTLTQSSIGANVFRSCPITKLVIHDQNLTNINVSGSGQYYITQELPNVTYIDLSDTNIQYASFRLDKQLVTAIIPANYSTLAVYNFVEGCENLQYIIITNTSQIVTPSGDTLKYMFKGKNAPNVNIYVPDTLLSQYQSSASWSDATYAPTFATTRIKGHSELPSNITWATKTSS